MKEEKASDILTKSYIFADDSNLVKIVPKRKKN